MFSNVTGQGDFCQQCKEAKPQRKHLKVTLEGGWQVCAICDVAPPRPAE